MNPEPLDCCCPDGRRFTTVTTLGSISFAASTMGSAPCGTTTGAVVASAVGEGDGDATNSLAVRPSKSVAVAPPATPPRITPMRSKAAPLGPVDRGAGTGAMGAAGSYISGGVYLRERAGVSPAGVVALRRRAVGR